jgi:ribonuclease HI
MNKPWKIYCDGGSRGNPGSAAAAFVVEENGKVLVKKGRYLGKATNNVAEYQAAILALEWLSENSTKLPEEIIFIHDSQLIARQLMGQYKIKNEILRKLYAVAKNFQKTIPSVVKFTSVPRSHNKIADFLVNKILNEN